MLSKTYCMTNIGLNSQQIEIEVDIAQGLPSFIIVGLGDTAVQESKERVRSAIKNSQLIFPLKKITANLAPADIRKIGPSFDLPIAIGILNATGQINANSDVFENTIFIGELALNGRLRHTNGILPIITRAIELGFKNIFLPKVNAPEASLLGNINIFGAKNLNQIIAHLQNEKKISKTEPIDFEELSKDEKFLTDFANVKGQEHAKRALEIAAAGAHNVLMNGSPGSGKTLMARAFSSILPHLTRQEAIEVTKIFSIANLLPSAQPMITTRQFRAVHHTASGVSIVGGGNIPKPGEISLAHRGVLFLDELQEFPSQVLEVLRQPLEDREITISRANGSTTYPAHFTLISAMNPCPCGYYGVPNSDKNCTCTPYQISRHKKKISGPLLDRFDLFIEISPVKFEKLASNELSEESVSIRKRVQTARDIQSKRFTKENITTNSEMNVKLVEKYCETNQETENLLKQAMKQFSLSARGYHRILKAARTIADLEKVESIELNHVAEALQFRPKIETI